MTAPNLETQAPYVARSNGFEVRVRPLFLPSHSDPENNRWVWSYHIMILNQSDHAARLLSRRWDIVDGAGRTEVVEGPGVVGQTPRIEPGDSFEYHSGCPLGTPSGSMHGAYTMQPDDDGEPFEVDIPAFALEVPNRRRTLN